MKLVLRSLLLAFTLWLSFGCFVKAQKYPDYNDIYVSDFANLLDDAQEARLHQQLAQLRNDTGIEFSVVTLDRMADYGWQGGIEPFATGLFNHWGIGNANRNDGIMLLVTKDDRQMRIELGAGYNTSYDRQMQRVIDHAILPHFRKGNFAAGIGYGVSDVINIVVPQEGTAAPSYASEETSPWWWSLLVAPFVAVGFPLWRRWQRYRPRRCHKDNGRMRRLEDFAAYQHLTPGQRRELLGRRARCA